MKTKTDPFKTTFNRDGSVTVWDVYEQVWVRTARPTDRILASLSSPERDRVIRHTKSDHKERP